MDFTWDKHIFIDDTNEHARRRFVRRLVHVFHKLFILNETNNYPLHIIQANIVKQLSNSSRLMKIQNRTGLSVSTDTLSRFHEGVAKHTKLNAMKHFNQNSPIVITVDNIDSLSPFAATTADLQNRCWHGTSVMAQQPLPDSDTLHQFENLSHNSNSFYPLKVFGDGRCFFRCIAVVSHRQLSECPRNMFSQAKIGNLHSVETNLADEIREVVVNTLADNLQHLLALPDGLQQYYLEKQAGVHYQSFDERLQDMKNKGTFAGPLEISAVAHCLKTQIHIYQINNGMYKKVAAYPSHLFGETTPILLAYTPDVDGTPGHFNVLYEGNVNSQRQWAFPKDEMIGNFALSEYFKDWADYFNKAQSYSNPSLYDVIDVMCEPPSNIENSNRTNSASTTKKFSTRLSESKIDRQNVSTSSYLETLFKTYIPQQITIDLFKSSSAEQEQSSKLSVEIFLYNLERLTIKKKNINAYLPNLKCKFAFESSETCEKSNFAYIDVYDLKADSTETIKTVLRDIYKEFGISTKLNHIVLCGDIKTFLYINKVKSECGHAMDWVIPFVGDWHILFNFQDVLLKKIFWDAGLKNIAKCTALSSLINSGKFKKTHRFLLQSYEALYMYQIDCFLSDQGNSGIQVEEKLMSDENILSVIEQVMCKLNNPNSDFTNVDEFIHSQNELKAKLIPSLWEKFDLWCVDMSVKFETFAFWNNFLKRDMFAYVQLYLGMRSRNWEGRMASIKHIATLMHAYDRPNYSRWLVVHLSQMFALPIYVLDHFKKGGFASSIKGNPFSCIAFDEGHECLNKDTKKIIVKSTPDSIGRICSTLPYQAQLIKNYELNVKDVQKNLPQRDFARTVILKEQTNVFTYYDKWTSSNIFGNVIQKSLFQAFSNKLPGKDQVHDLLSYADIGYTKMMDFVEGRIIKSPSSKKAVARKSKLKTFAEKRMTPTYVKNLEKDKALVTRCYIRTMDLIQKGKFRPSNTLQFLETPRAMCTKDGLPYKGTKSNMYKVFNTRYESEGSGPIVDVMKFKANNVCLIAEGMNLIYKKPEKGEKYFVGYANMLFKNVLLYYFRCGYNDVRILFDDAGSQGISPKCIEQERRDHDDEIEKDMYSEITDTSVLPSNWAGFLKLRKNKHLLCNYLFHRFQEIVGPYLSSDTKFIVSGGFHHALNDKGPRSVCVTRDRVTEYTFQFENNAVSQNHEESDTQIWLHVLDTNCDTVHIRSKDRDIGVIGISHFEKFATKQIYIEFQQEPIKYLDLNMLHHAFCNDPDLVSLPAGKIGHIVQVLYIASGCDFVSYFEGQGKSTFLKILCQYCRFIAGQKDSNFGSLHNTDHDSSRLGLLAFYRLIGCVYFQSNRVSLNKYDTPENVFKTCTSTDILTKHHQYLDIIRQGTWKGEYENSLLPSNAALAFFIGKGYVGSVKCGAWLPSHNMTFLK
ncbi:uncharacterized protein [Amphiura filiformis]|uniref:uncharacterized protein n=1 Tax=Amphiura filiformis TaxID=82378 RepID=UPI003B22169C